MMVDIIRTDVCFAPKNGILVLMNERPVSRAYLCPPQPKNVILFCRFPQTLVQAAQRQRPFVQRHLPLVVTEGRVVRAACSQAASVGIAVGQGVVKARRLCPALVAVPLEAVDHHAETSAFLDVLADITPTVEPDGADAAYAVLDHRHFRSIEAAVASAFKGLGSCIVGYGSSRLAARACAECSLTSDRLADAAVEWLWPDDPKVVAALKRLGLDTFGQVAAVGEGALFYQFGKIGRLLHRRAQGQDLLPVRPLWPPLRADAVLNLDEYPITERVAMETAISQVCQKAEAELRALGRHGRRVVLRVETEAGAHRREWVLPAPIQSASAVKSAALRLLSQMRLSAPMTAVRILLEGLETPAARTNDLFLRGPGDDPLALEAVRRSLQMRFGTGRVILLSQRPRSVREERRACLHEKWSATL